MPSKLVPWKDIQTRAKAKSKTKLALAVLGLIILLIVFSQIFQFSKNLFSPRTPQNLQRSYTWNGEFSLNLVLKSKSVSVVSYNPTDQKVVIVDIPDETYVDVARGFGSWQLRSVYDLGQSSLLKETLTNFLGIPIDGFLDFSGPVGEKNASEILGLVRKNPLSSLKLLSYLQTDLTDWELLKFELGLLKVRFDKIEKINLARGGVLQRSKLLDGTDIFLADPVKIDGVISGLIDPKIQSEHKTIAIFNATVHPNLAQKGARLVTNLGADVIIVANSDQILEKTQVIGEQSKTLKRLLQVFNISDKITSAKVVQSSRAQINVFLGEDFYQRQ